MRSRAITLGDPGALRRVPAGAGAGFLGSIRAWIDNHSDQVIIVGSLVLGLWLVGELVGGQACRVGCVE